MGTIFEFHMIKGRSEAMLEGYVLNDFFFDVTFSFVAGVLLYVCSLSFLSHLGPFTLFLYVFENYTLPYVLLLCLPSRYTAQAFSMSYFLCSNIPTFKLYRLSISSRRLFTYPTCKLLGSLFPSLSSPLVCRLPPPHLLLPINSPTSASHSHFITFQFSF